MLIDLAVYASTVVLFCEKGKIENVQQQRLFFGLSLAHSRIYIKSMSVDIVVGFIAFLA